MNTSDRNFSNGWALSEASLRDVDSEDEESSRDGMRLTVANAENEETTDCRFEVRHLMLQRVARTDAFFKHQLMTDPDLTFFEKLSIASELLDRKPATFLERYGKYLVTDDLVYFEPFRNDYFVDFHLRELTRNFNRVTKDDKKVKNRRFEALKRLIATGEYFSDDETKKRDPLLFEEMIGQFLTSKDVADSISKSDLSLSEILLTHLQVMQNNELFDEQQERQLERQKEEEKRLADAEEFDLDNDSEEENDETGQPTEKERANLRSEFLEIMQQRFLSGQDNGFDYGEVDNNEDYDSIDLFSRDEEDRYFAGDSDYDDFNDGDLRGDEN